MQIPTAIQKSHAQPSLSLLDEEDDELEDELPDW